MDNFRKPCKFCEIGRAPGSDFCSEKHRDLYNVIRNGIDNLRIIERKIERKYTDRQLKAFGEIADILSNKQI